MSSEWVSPVDALSSSAWLPFTTGKIYVSTCHWPLFQCWYNSFSIFSLSKSGYPFHSHQHGPHLQVCDVLHVKTFCFFQRWVQIAILICLESSFWYSQQNLRFPPAFEQAWKIFTHSDAKTRVEQDISILIMPGAPTALNRKFTEQEKATFFDIILRNRLGKLSTSWMCWLCYSSSILERPDAQHIFWAWGLFIWPPSCGTIHPLRVQPPPSRASEWWPVIVLLSYFFTQCAFVKPLLRQSILSALWKAWRLLNH